MLCTISLISNAFCRWLRKPCDPCHELLTTKEDNNWTSQNYWNSMYIDTDMMSLMCIWYKSATKCQGMIILKIFHPEETFTSIGQDISIRNISFWLYMWLDIGKPTELSHWAYSILLAQLMATLIHYTFTLPLSGLVDWSAFLERLLLTL